MNYIEIDERIAQLEAKIIVEKQELITEMESVIDELQPLNIVEGAVRQVLRTKWLRSLIFGAGLKLMSGLIHKNKSA